MSKIKNLSDIEKILSTTFCDISYEKSTNISTLTESQNKTSQAVDSYNISFNKEYIIINADDKQNGRNRHKNVKTSKCFDYLCIGIDEIICIELKNEVGLANLKDLPLKLYFGYLQTLPIMSISDINRIKYMIVYTSENFMRKKSTHLRESVKMDDHKYTEHWKKNQLIIEDKYIPHIHCFSNGTISIIRHPYSDKQPIIV